MVNKTTQSKPQQTIISRLLLSHLLIVFVSLSGIGGFTLFALQTEFYDGLSFFLSLEANSYQRARQRGDQLAAISELSSRGLWLLIYELPSERPGTPLLLPSNRPTLKYNTASQTPINPVFWQSLRRSINDDKSVYFQHQQGIGGKQWLFISRQLPTLQPSDPPQVLQLGLPVAALIGAPFERSVRLLLLLGGLLTALTSLLIYFLANWLSRPIKRIDRQARRIAQTGDLSELLDQQRFSVSELKALAGSFNQMVEQLRSEKNFQREFIANASHELKTPVMAIGSAVEVLQNTTPDDPEHQHFMEILGRQSQRLRELTTSLLDVSTLESGQVQLTISEFPVADLIENCARDLELAFKQAKQDFSWYAPPNLTILADRPKLAQALTNLLSNAIKYTPANGEVFVQAELTSAETLTQAGHDLTELLPELASKSQLLTISVADSGVGISETDCGLIFKRFYRADHDRSRLSGGTGLGLAIAAQIARLHGGGILLQSTPGKGSEFTLLLPISE